VVMMPINAASAQRAIRTIRFRLATLEPSGIPSLSHRSGQSAMMLTLHYS